MDNSSQYDSVFPYALAMCDNLSDHQKRDEKSEMDDNIDGSSHCNGDHSMFFVCNNGEMDQRNILNEEWRKIFAERCLLMR